jgi:hypothetical protein
LSTLEERAVSAVVLRTGFESNPSLRRGVIRITSIQTEYEKTHHVAMRMYGFYRVVYFLRRIVFRAGRHGTDTIIAFQEAGLSPFRGKSSDNQKILDRVQLVQMK